MFSKLLIISKIFAYIKAQFLIPQHTSATQPKLHLCSPYAGPIKFCEARLLRRIGVQDCKKGYATGHHQISICVVTFVIIAHTLNHILIITINTRGVGKVRCAENNLCLFPESNFCNCFGIKNVIFHRVCVIFHGAKLQGIALKPPCIE